MATRNKKSEEVKRVGRCSSAKTTAWMRFWETLVYKTPNVSRQPFVAVQIPAKDKINGFDARPKWELGRKSIASWSKLTEVVGKPNRVLQDAKRVPSPIPNLTLEKIRQILICWAISEHSATLRYARPSHYYDGSITNCRYGSGHFYAFPSSKHSNFVSLTNAAVRADVLHLFFTIHTPSTNTDFIQAGLSIQPKEAFHNATFCHGLSYAMCVAMVYLALAFFCGGICFRRVRIKLGSTSAHHTWKFSTTSESLYRIHHHQRN
jgi:hypothetical protein